jgi:hypothetical protein
VPIGRRPCPPRRDGDETHLWTLLRFAEDGGQAMVARDARRAVQPPRAARPRRVPDWLQRPHPRRLHPRGSLMPARAHSASKTMASVSTSQRWSAGTEPVRRPRALSASTRFTAEPRNSTAASAGGWSWTTTRSVTSTATQPSGSVVSNTITAGFAFPNARATAGPNPATYRRHARTSSGSSATASPRGNPTSRSWIQESHSAWWTSRRIGTSPGGPSAIVDHC